MIKIYNWFGGRKIFFFYLLLAVNVYFLKWTDKWTEGFGYFTVFLYATIVVGIESNKAIKGKYGQDSN